MPCFRKHSIAIVGSLLLSWATVGAVRTASAEPTSTTGVMGAVVTRADKSGSDNHHTETAASVDDLTHQADRGDYKAQHTLAAIYETGTGVKQDYAASLKWWRTLADQGDREGAETIGRFFDAGRGVEPDKAEAARWYRVAAERGDNMASVLLAAKYEKGEGVPQSYKDAARWYRLPAQEGDTTAQARLGRLYASGRGVKQDYAAAYYWLSLPSHCHDEERDTLQTLTAVRQHLTTGDIRTIEKRVADFQWPAWSGIVSLTSISTEGQHVTRHLCGCDCEWKSPATGLSGTNSHDSSAPSLSKPAPATHTLNH